MKKKYRKKLEEKNKARLMIPKLFDLAKEAFVKDKSVSNRYIKKARNLAMKYKIRIKPTLKRSFCKHCYSYMVPGNNCRVRIIKNKVVYSCLECNSTMRFPYIREKKIKSKP